SISLIPDEIKVSLFIRQCSTLLDIEERALLTELNKIRIARSKENDRKKNLQNRQSGDTPPADFLLADPEERQHHDQLSSPDGEIRQEREIVRILLNYGRDLVTWEGDGSVPIAPYLL